MDIAAYHKNALMDHYRNPRNRGDLVDAHAVGRGTNPLCGDEVEIGVWIEASRFRTVAFRARACSICIASSSLMSEAMQGQAVCEGARVQAELERWLDGGDIALPASLAVLTPLRAEKARRRCILLPWEGLQVAINALQRS